MTLQHLRSSTANKRPTPASMADGQVAINTNDTSPGLFFKDNNGALVKIGPVHVGTTAPNASPASGGQSGNSKGELWLDTSGTNPVLKVWDGSAWQSEAGEFVNVSGDTMTGTLTIDDASLVVQGDSYRTLTLKRFNSSNAGQLDILLKKARGTKASPSAVQISDNLGRIAWTGYDGTNDIEAAAIQATVSATPGTNDMPGKLSFWTTADGASSPIERASIDQNGNVTINAQSDLRLADADSSNWVALQAPATVASNVTWTLPSADGSSGQVLSTNGTGTLSWATAGGGSLTHFAESENTSSPNATIPVDAFTATDASYSNIDVAFVAKGTGSTLAHVPDGTATGGNKRGTYATDLQKSRTAATQVASGAYSVIAGGLNSSATGAYSTVSGGQTNTASGSWSSVVGGFSSTASGTYSFIAGGYSNTASGSYSFACGDNNDANGSTSTVLGGANGTARSITGYCVFPATDTPISAVAGVSQTALLVLGRPTTDATATVLTSNSSAAGTTNQVVLPNNSAYSFSGEVIAGVTGGGNTARWTINGAIKRGANAASTTMVGTPTVTMTHNDAGASAWTVAVAADTTNGAIKVTVTGAASTTIRWVCKINTTEMTY